MKTLSTSTTPITNILRILLLAALFVGVIFYVAYQSRNLIGGPQIALDASLESVHTERTIEVSGTTRNITELTMNGRPIFTDESGSFRQRLVLENGYTIMTLQARDRFGRETSLTKDFIYKPNL